MTKGGLPVAPASKDRIPVLDGYRVILVFLVSWYHIWQQSWLTPRLPLVGSLDFLMRSGYVHVDGMILLSGFLLFRAQYLEIERRAAAH